MTVRYAADDIVYRFPRNCGSGLDSHSSVCSLAIWLESPEKVGGTACVADLKRNFYLISEHCKTKSAIKLFVFLSFVNVSIVQVYLQRLNSTVLASSRHELDTKLKGLILAQNERWRRGLGMQVEREPARGTAANGVVTGR